MKILNKQRKENKPCPLCNNSNKLVTTFDKLNDQPIIDAIQEDRSDWNLKKESFTSRTCSSIASS